MNRQDTCRHNGRDLQAPTQPSVRLTLDVPRDEWEVLERTAKQHGSTPHKLIEGAIASRLSVCTFLLDCGAPGETTQ